MGYPSSDEKFLTWRAERLSSSGFSDVEVVQLIEWEVDTHAAVDLVDKGCPHSTVVRILRPLHS